MPFALAVRTTEHPDGCHQARPVTARRDLRRQWGARHGTARLAPRGKQVAQVSSAAESARLAEQARRDAKRRLVVYAGAGTALAAVVGLVLYLLLRRT